LHRFSFSHDFKEFLIVGAVMTLILLPVRLLFVEFVNNSTLGSIGVISLISIVMLVLVKKKKLGSFGQMFERQMFRLTKGKRRIFVLTMMSISLIYFSFSLIAIEQGNTIYFVEKESVKAQLEDNYNIDFSGEELIKQVLDPQKVVAGIPEYVDSVFSNFKEIAIVQAIIK